ncbi:MAG: WbuC family cupin fold metalloprotein [Campylobacterales bacterium]|nr:WbuC family cupin fold metalloprotein [Campylobacterales bacterium]
MENVYVDKNFVSEISQKAEESPRNRMNFNFHKSEEDPIQRFVNHMLPTTYVTPHKHPLGTDIETFVILKGHAVMVTFTEDGEIKDLYELDPKQENFAVEINAREFHTLVVLEESSFYEIKRGPYDQAIDKEFASWAPLESDELGLVYLEELKSRVKRRINPI